jgi:hypothetical protein
VLREKYLPEILSLLRGLSELIGFARRSCNGESDLIYLIGKVPESVECGGVLFFHGVVFVQLDDNAQNCPDTC